MELKELSQIFKVVTTLNENTLFFDPTKETKLEDGTVVKGCLTVLEYEIFKKQNQFIIRDKDHQCPGCGKEHETVTDLEGVIQYIKGMTDACDDYFVSSKHDIGEGHPLYEASYKTTMFMLCMPDDDDDDLDDGKKKLPDFLQN